MRCTCQKLNNAAGHPPTGGRTVAGHLFQSVPGLRSRKGADGRIAYHSELHSVCRAGLSQPLIEAGTNSLPFLREIEQQNDPRADLARACRTIIEGEVQGVSKPQPSAAGGRCLVSYSVSNRPLRNSAWASEPGSPEIRIFSGIARSPATFSYTVAGAKTTQSLTALNLRVG